jgi:hypothetical protein
MASRLMCGNSDWEAPETGGRHFSTVSRDLMQGRMHPFPPSWAHGRGRETSSVDSTELSSPVPK